MLMSVRFHKTYIRKSFFILRDRLKEGHVAQRRSIIQKYDLTQRVEVSTWPQPVGKKTWKVE